MGTYRVSLVYRANGMLRPLTHRVVGRAETVSQAVDVAVSSVSSAYESGFIVLSWTCEMLDKRPVKVRRPLSDKRVSEVEHGLEDWYERNSG